MPKKKFYAVKKGVQTGLFDTWEECRCMVLGFPGAVYKSFGTKQEAEEYLNEISQMQPQVQESEPESDSMLTAYVDGSFDKKIRRYSFGCVFLTPDGEIIRESGSGNNPKSLELRNVAGEMLGAMFAVQWALKNGYPAMNICYDYAGIEQWATHSWQAKNDLTRQYAAFMDRCSQKIRIRFTKIAAHTGDPYNEEADQLAKKALTEKDGKDKDKMKITILMEDTCGSPDCSHEHGLSVYIETNKHKLLVDTGATDAFIKNAEKLGIDLTKVDTVILSHGHYDHAGGILSFHELNPDAEIYMQKTACDDYYHDERYIGIDKRIATLDCVRMLNGDYRIDDELFLFTNITGRKYFAKSNLLLSKRVNGKNIQDQFAHEQCLVITQKQEHTLISGCAHNGILNILDRYQELFSDQPRTVISGFHMVKKGGYEQEEIEIICETAKHLSQMDTIFYTGHCTGNKAFTLMKPYMKDQLIEIHTGMQISERAICK